MLQLDIYSISTVTGILQHINIYTFLQAFLYKYQLYSRSFDCTLNKMLMSLKRPIAMFSPLALLGPVPPAARMICLWMSIFSRSSQKREITSTSNPSWARRVVWSEVTGGRRLVTRTSVNPPDLYLKSPPLQAQVRGGSCWPGLTQL